MYNCKKFKCYVSCVGDILSGIYIFMLQKALEFIFDHLIMIICNEGFLFHIAILYFEKGIYRPSSRTRKIESLV